MQGSRMSVKRGLGFTLALCCLGTAARGQSVEQADEESLTSDTASGNSSEGADFQQAVDLIIRKTNRLRSAHRLQPVVSQQELTSAARYFADYMARTDRYGHGADGKRPSERARRHGYDYCIVLENIAYVYRTGGYDMRPLAAKFFQGWKHSPEHRRNMLDPDVEHTGVAVARSKSTGNYYAVQMFGRPATARIDIKITNRSGEQVEYTLADREYVLPPRYSRTHGQCRPALLAFSWARGYEQVSTRPAVATRPAKLNERAGIFRVKDGTEYVVRTDRSGEPMVSEERFPQPASE